MLQETLRRGRLRRKGRPIFVCAVIAAFAFASADARAAESRASEPAAARVPRIVAPPIYGAINVEKVYYKQSQLIREAAEALAGQRPGIPDLYFIGFAGDATQDVFLREMQSVRALFDARFDTEGRSLTLINNRATVATVPLANAHNLLAALDEVARRMDPDEDVLFLFLTSHGLPDVLAVEFEPLRLNALSARDLRAILDRSGIKWRVVVVSACYSGSFIEPLKDDATMIVTATRHDRVSFGCSHENGFTYFGRAYFDQALRRTHSFAAAFEATRTTIERWETEERLDPSLPQIFVGDSIRPKLAEIEKRLRSLAPAH